MNGTKTETPRRNQRRQLRSMIANERRARNNFYIFELGFIFVIIPLLVVSFFIGPMLYYYAIQREFFLWPFIIIGILISFFEIIAIQHFIKRFYLEPHNMTLGEFLRYKFDTQLQDAEISATKGENNLSWYEDLDEFIENLKTKRKERTERIYATAYQINKFENV